MTSATISETKPRTLAQKPGSVGKSKKIFWTEFQNRFLGREDGYKYEWVNQEVVKSEHMDSVLQGFEMTVKSVFHREPKPEND